MVIIGVDIVRPSPLCRGTYAIWSYAQPSSVLSDIPVVGRSFGLRFRVWQLHADRRQGDVAGEASDWEPIKEDMVNAIGCALY
jgi:hypothetical protein